MALVMTLEFCEGKISFYLPEQTRSSSTDSELFTDIIEKCFDNEYQKEQEVLRKQLKGLVRKKTINYNYMVQMTLLFIKETISLCIKMSHCHLKVYTTKFYKHT